ncbi:hypothetical protein LARI1_G000924 [Lachnellula arida]|uniref:Ubiquitin-like domain-containing protein n=1 Tax=Lachnellula arida TaxID=1316785 RepID=A0A8T9BKH2_9HELO|nr:hypothetical protein LARI1_G000924 [Lachnellula arida]
MAGDIAQAVTEPSEPPPKKKSLFSKKLIAQVAEDAEGVAFFSRSSELFPQRLAEEEQRRQKKALKLERKRSSASLEKKEPSPQEEKRRRISKDRDLYSSEEDAEASWARRESTTSTPGSGSRKSRSASARKNQASPTSLAVRYSRDLRAAKKEEPVVKPETKGYISLSESDDEDVKPVRARNEPIVLDDDDIYSIPQKPKPKPVELDPELSDEEFPELLQQARERERLKALAREKESKSFKEQNHTSNDLDDDIFQTESSKAVVDPIIEVLVTSKIDDTKPLLVKRKVSQRLKEVKTAWCDHQTNDGQPMASEIKDSIFLTWNGKRLYDVTSCKSLNLNIDSSGKISSQGEGVDFNGRVHLEAWTEDSFKAHQNKEAARLQREQDGADEDEEEVIEEQVVKKIRLILKSRELGESKMTVKPTTLIQKLINAFRQDKKVAEHQEISLQVDGEKLDPEEKIEDTELEDMEVVEVHIR